MKKDYLNEVLNEKNGKRYENGKIIESYMHEKYHVLRLQLAFELLKQSICDSFPVLDNAHIQMLEIAGSTGYMSGRLLKEGYSVLLTDLESAPLELAVQRNPELRTMAMDASGIFPFKDCTFHAIYAGDIIEHLFDTSLFLSECYRCLKPEGVLVLTTPNLASIGDRINFLFGISPRQVNPTHEFLCLHIRPFTYRKLKEVLSDTGFGDFHVTSNLIRINIGHFKKDFYYLAKKCPTLGRSLIVAAFAHKE